MTELQLDAVRDEVSIFLSDIFTDYQERHEVLDLIINDVLEDIEVSADWSDYDEDEYCLADIRFALARVLKAAVVFNYTGE